MDSRLQDRLIKIHERIDILKGLESRFLEISAHEKVMFSKMLLETSGTVEERKARVYADEGWSDFMKGLVVAEVEYLEAKRRYELALKAYDAEHLTFKNELPAIKRQL